MSIHIYSIREQGQHQLIKVGTGTREEWQEAEHKEKQEKKGTEQEQ
jgi:hypothetical protein